MSSKCRICEPVFTAVEYLTSTLECTTIRQHKSVNTLLKKCLQYGNCKTTVPNGNEEAPEERKLSVEQRLMSVVDENKFKLFLYYAPNKALRSVKHLHRRPSKAANNVTTRNGY